MAEPTASAAPLVVEAIGMTAGVLTTIAFLPQAIKAWRTKSTADISLAMFLILVTGVFLWLVYGAFIGSPSLVLANGVTFVIALFILYLKLRHG